MQFDQLKRRDFITLLGGAVAAWPLTVHAQQGERMRRIGVLIGTLENDPEASLRVGEFRQALAKLGWSEGRNVSMDIRFVRDSSVDQAQVPAKGLIALQPDVILAQSTPVVAALQRETRAIPIVFTAVADPIGSGFVASIPRPGGNVTGSSIQATDLAGKRVGLLREAVPGLRSLAIMANSDSPAPVVEMREAQATARALGLEVVISEIRHPEDIAPAIEALKGRTDALYVVTEPLVNASRIRISTLALGAQLPTMHGTRDYIEAGSLMSYGANYPDMFWRAADYVDKILRGAKPADLPVEQPTKFDLVINLTTAKALGLDVPATLLTRADEVLE